MILCCKYTILFSFISDFNRNVIYPNVFEPFALNINEDKPTIEIIEINSDESEKQCSQNNTSYSPSVKSEDENKNKVKGQTKRKRNVTSCEQNYTNDRENHSEDDLNETFNSHCGGDYDKHNIYYNRVDRLNNVTFDTSSDDQYDDIKIIHFNDKMVNDNPWDFNSDAITDHDDDIKKFIYSLKGMKNSYENYYDVSNASFDDSTSRSTDDDEIIKNRSTFPAPIYNWIPKLNLLSSPLPAVTELTETYTYSSSDITDEGKTRKFVKKSANSWFDENTNRDQSHQKSENLTKLSTLSQREKRRNKVANILNKQTGSKEQVIVYCEPECKSTLNFENINTTMNVTDGPNITINKEDAVTENVNVFDAPKQVYLNLPEPQIKCNSLLTTGTNEISEPIEELGESGFNNSPNEVIVYDYDLDTVENSDKQSISKEEGNSNCTFVSKCLDLSQNVPEPNSIPHLQLSLDTNFDEDKSCFKRFFKFILCCK